MRKCIFYLVVSLLTCMVLGSCGSDKDSDTNTNSIPSDLLGMWSGYQTTQATGNHRTLIMFFYSDGTGSLEFESSVYYRYASFYYTFNGNTINCKGVLAGEDGNVDEDWQQSFKYDGNCIEPLGAYSDIILYKNGEAPDDDTDISGDSFNGGGSTSNTSNVNFSINFESWNTVYYSKKKTYSHQIFVTFGVPQGTYNQGISSFNLYISSDDATRLEMIMSFTTVKKPSIWKGSYITWIKHIHGETLSS